MTPREVRVVPHDPVWAESFESEAALLRSVPGLAAKPTIDVLIEVQEIGRVDDLDGAMTERGHEACGEYGILGRRVFVKIRGPVRTHNVHVFEAGTPEVERHLAFRDYLIQTPETASAYGTLKKDLAKKFLTDIESYMDGKDALIKEVERKAISHSRAKRGKLKC